jgi:hypothetical protein
LNDKYEQNRYILSGWLSFGVCKAAEPVFLLSSKTHQPEKVQSFKLLLGQLTDRLTVLVKRYVTVPVKTRLRGTQCNSPEGRPTFGGFQRLFLEHRFTNKNLTPQPPSHLSLTLPYSWEGKGKTFILGRGRKNFPQEHRGGGSSRITESMF